MILINTLIFHSLAAILVRHLGFYQMDIDCTVSEVYYALYHPPKRVTIDDYWENNRNFKDFVAILEDILKRENVGKPLIFY